MGDHPRACGEKPYAYLDSLKNPGSPPRVRGKEIGWNEKYLSAGITPARAGKSKYVCEMKIYHWDHPRACGEKDRLPVFVAADRGSPPRVRGKVVSFSSSILPMGITPARAGKSVSPGDAVIIVKDHPRACGEKNYFRRWT